MIFRGSAAPVETVLRSTRLVEDVAIATTLSSHFVYHLDTFLGSTPRVIMTH